MLNTDGRHEAIQEFKDAFNFAHLPAGLPRQVSETFHEHAAALLVLLPDAPALTRAIHDLWRSKNEAVLLAVRIAATGNTQTPTPVERVRLVADDQRATNPFEPAQDRHPDVQPGRTDGPVNATDKPAAPARGLVIVDDSGTPMTPGAGRSALQGRPVTDNPQA